MSSQETMKSLQSAIENARKSADALSQAQKEVSRLSAENQTNQNKLLDLRNQLDQELDEEMGVQNRDAKLRGVTVK